MNAKELKIPICRHIRISGRRCQSPTVTGSLFCFFHRSLRHGHDAASTAKIGPLRPETVQYLLENGQNPSQFAHSTALNLPPLEDAEAIQLSISLLFAAIAAGQIDPILARNLLYALQIASCNLRVLSSGSKPGDDFSTLARRVVRTRNGQTLAARGDRNGVPPEAESRESRFAEMLNDLLHPKDTAPDATPQTE
ncbi:MAG: hypothetical protein ABSF57_00310 [Acidobacteriaceae bacterium]|jgi:hypothetical protein